MSYKAVFLDRDNTLIEDPGYINSPDQVKLLPGSADALIQLRTMGYKLVIVTNQSAVARGILTKEVLEEIHQRLEKLFEHRGAYIDRIYYCPFHPDGVIAEYRKESNLRKPNPGMLLTAADEMNIELSQSWMIGNSFRDISAGKQAGCRTILLNTPGTQTVKKPQDPIPDEEAVNLKEAVNIIKMYERMPKDQAKDNSVSEVSTPVNPPKAAYKPGPKPSGFESDVPKPAAAHHKTRAEVDQPDTDKTHRVIEEILRQLKNTRRTDMFDEFSATKLLAGLVQVLVFFCLLISLWFLLDHTRDITYVYTTLGYAMVLQLMAIAFFLMRNRK